MADKRKVRTWLIIGVALGVISLVFLFSVVVAVFVEKLRQDSCLGNLGRGISYALLAYIADNDGVLPAASQWTDKVKPYLLYDYFFVCPSAKQLKCGYAFYRPLSGRKVATIAKPETVPMLFDSSKGQFNYADEGQSLDPRHFRGANISFVDGHAWWFKESDAKAFFRKRP